MRSSISLLLAVAAITGLALFTGARRPATCDVTIRLVDADTGRELPGLLAITTEDGEAIIPAELLSRGMGLGKDLPIARWSVLPKSRSVRLPRSKLTVTAIRGLETEAAKVAVDLTGRDRYTLTIPLTRFYDASAKGWRSGNTHLHLQKISRENCDRYLLEVPKADDLDAVFVSYLERATADREYTSNRYTRRDLAKLQERSGTTIGNGEEHRHNFTGFGQGYGHVMFLDITRLVQPVSIGPGIMQTGTDGIPLARGIDSARRDGGTVVWCHNDWGMEAVPNFLAGRVHAQNIFDGGTHGSYKDSFYRYLNAGMNVPFSSGTDWFMYDFSRVYCHLGGELTVKNWLKSLAAGRSYITNGPLLEFTVNGEHIGSSLNLAKPRSVAVKATGRGRIDFGRLELVSNGRVVQQSKTRKVGGHYEAEVDLRLEIDEPCWLCVRTPPPPVKGDAELTAAVQKNELGRELFAHTSTIHVTIGGRSRFDAAVAKQLLTEMQRNRDTINEKGKFADAAERARVLDVYADGIAAMQRRLK